MLHEAVGHGADLLQVIELLAEHDQTQTHHVRVDLHRGTAHATVWTCDLSHDYVSINADYRS